LNNLFKKAAVFTDIHFGLKNNSKLHNEDCVRFVKWFIKQAKESGCETCIFTGDWSNSRSTINVSTLNYSVMCIALLSEAFENVYLIMGNHDLYYREKRDLNSMPYADLHDNVHIIGNERIEQGNVAFIPWLVEDEWESMKQITSKYIFGHFELPHFKMNAMVTMPDNGRLQGEHFTTPDYVFSGHFHKRQNRGKIHYIGNPFPHNYADAWDDDRGMMILEWGGVPEYRNWEDGPRYRTVALSKLIDDGESFLNSNTYCRVTLDVGVSYEEAVFIKETYSQQYNLREIALLPSKKEDHSTEWGETPESEIQNVDQIVYSQLKSVDSNSINSNKLMEIYSQL
jgi:DNA repair exonuclease SbcCD nuclease subunit